jgi:hypothetical protein
LLAEHSLSGTSASARWKAILRLALDLETTVQDLGAEACNDLMARHGLKVKIESAWE